MLPQAQMVAVPVGERSIETRLDGLHTLPANGANYLRLRRTHGGRPKKEESHEGVLLSLWADSQHPDIAHEVSHHYPRYDEEIVQKVSPTIKKNRTAKLLTLIDGMERGHFPAAPSESCPQCPYFLICPAQAPTE